VTAIDVGWCWWQYLGRAVESERVEAPSSANQSTFADWVCQQYAHPSHPAPTPLADWWGHGLRLAKQTSSRYAWIYCLSYKPQPTSEAALHALSSSLPPLSAFRSILERCSD